MAFQDRLTAAGTRAPRGASALALAVMAVLGWGCAHVEVHAPVVSATPMGAYMLAAKPPDCAMPVLSAMPPRDFHQVAIVEVYADRSATDDELRRLLQRKACAAGADALVITTEREQKEGEKIRGAQAGHPNIGPGSEDPEGGPKHHPEVGEVGHAERYLGGVAIVFPKSAGGPAASPASGQ